MGETHGKKTTGNNEPQSGSTNNPQKINKIIQ
jgi:hypothetical protein